MFKRIDILVRRPDLGLEEFMTELVEENGPKIKNVPGVRGYVINDIIPHNQAATVGLLYMPEFDTITEIWFDSLEALRAAEEESAFTAWADERKALLSKQCSLVAEEMLVIVPKGTRAPLKNINFNNRKLGLTLEEYRKEWHGRHSELAYTVPHIEAFANDEVIAELPQTGVERLETELVQGVAMTHFIDDDQQNAMIASSEAKVWFSHGQQTFGRCHAYSAWERVIIDPSAK